MAGPREKGPTWLAAPTSSSHGGPIALIQIAVDQRAASSRDSDGPAAPPYPPSDGGYAPSRPFRAVENAAPVSPPVQPSGSPRIIGVVRLAIRRAAHVAGTACQSGVPAERASTAPTVMMLVQIYLLRRAPRTFLVLGGHPAILRLAGSELRPPQGAPTTFE
jgi:hypothetical protein